MGARQVGRLFVLAGLWVAVVVGSYEVSAKSQPGDPVAAVLHVTGEARRLRDVSRPESLEDRIKSAPFLQAGDSLHQGDYLRVGVGGVVIIRFKNESTVRLGPGSDLHLKRLETGSGGAPPSRIQLMFGRLWMHVREVFLGGFEVEVEEVVAAVKGTEFAVDYPAEGTGDVVEVLVYQGEVEVRHLKTPESVRLGKGESVRTVPGGRYKFEKKSFKPWEQRDTWFQFNRDLSGYLSEHPEILQSWLQGIPQQPDLKNRVTEGMDKVIRESKRRNPGRDRPSSPRSRDRS